MASQLCSLMCSIPRPGSCQSFFGVAVVDWSMDMEKFFFSNHLNFSKHLRILLFFCKQMTFGYILVWCSTLTSWFRDMSIRFHLNLPCWTASGYGRMVLLTHQPANSMCTSHSAGSESPTWLRRILRSFQNSRSRFWMFVLERLEHKNWDVRSMVRRARTAMDATIQAQRRLAIGRWNVKLHQTSNFACGKKPWPIVKGLLD